MDTIWTWKQKTLLEHIVDTYNDLYKKEKNFPSFSAFNK